jgi:hypothetical protein
MEVISGLCCYQECHKLKKDLSRRIHPWSKHYSWYQKPGGYVATISVIVPVAKVIAPTLMATLMPATAPWMISTLGVAAFVWWAGRTLRSYYATNEYNKNLRNFEHWHEKVSPKFTVSSPLARALKISGWEFFNCARNIVTAGAIAGLTLFAQQQHFHSVPNKLSNS